MTTFDERALASLPEVAGFTGDLRRRAFGEFESLPTPSAVRKAEREIGEFRKYQQISRNFIEVNEEICRLRPAEDSLTSEEKKRPQRSASGSG